MTLFQPDASTADMCGNGARCAARWVAERTGADSVMLDTQAGTRRADVDGETVTVEMGTPRFDPAEVPVLRDDPMVEESLAGYDVTAVHTGVPTPSRSSTTSTTWTSRRTRPPSAATKRSRRART